LLFLNLTLLRSKSLHFNKGVKIWKPQIRALCTCFSNVFLKVNAEYTPLFELSYRLIN